MSPQSIGQLLAATAAANSEKAAYRYKRDGQWVDQTWPEFEQAAARVSRSLLALGVEHGARVSILAETRLEWVQADFGIAGCGGVTVGIYHSSLEADCAYVLNHCEAVGLFVENAAQMEKIDAVRDQLSSLQWLVIIDGDSDPARGVMSWDEFLARGTDVSDEQLEARANAITVDDLASLVYTSGTTGAPKGVMLTHENLLAVTDSAAQALYIEYDFTCLLFLPLAHVFARLIVHCCVRAAATIAFAESIPKVPQNLKEVRPDFIVSVPRIYEKMYDAIVSAAESAGGIKKKLFDWAVDVGMQASKLRQVGQPIPFLLRLKLELATKLVLHKVQDAVGGRLIYGISGAAPLNPMIAEFFDACGVLILEGIGMTENSSFTNVNLIDNNKFGTVGPVAPGIEMLIAEDGEVLYRGKNVMKGYYKDPAATAETIDEDGWLHTGDIGEIDEDGFLKITDRKKDLIVTAGGKNVAPQRIEKIMRTSHYISQVMAHGDKQRYVAALITLDADAIKEWAVANGLGSLSLDELARDNKVRTLIEGEVEERNHQLASFETVKTFHILAQDFTIETGELTPTLKLKRKIVATKYATELASLF